MVQTINPAVSEDRGRWIGALAGFVGSAWVGSLVSAMMVFGLVAIIGVAHEPAANVLAMVAVSLVILRDVGVTVGVPYRSRQVPEFWRHEVPVSVVAMPYGFLLGFGFATPFVSAAHLAALLGAAVSRSALMALMVSALFALGRSSILLTGIGVKDLDQLDERLTTREIGSKRRDWARKVAGLMPALLVLAALAANLGNAA